MVGKTANKRSVSKLVGSTMGNRCSVPLRNSGNQCGTRASEVFYLGSEGARELYTNSYQSLVRDCSLSVNSLVFLACSVLR